MALPTTGMVRMPFTEQVNLIRNALGTIRRRVPEVEKNLEREGRKCHIVRTFNPRVSWQPKSHSLPVQSPASRQCEARDPPKTGQEPPRPRGTSPLTQYVK